MSASHNSIVRICSILFFIVALAENALSKPERSLANFDRRETMAATNQPPVDAIKEKAADQLRLRVKGLHISRHQIFGSPSYVASPMGFLTGSNGVGKAVSTATGKIYLANEPHRGVKTFLTEHQALFGFGPEALTAAKINKDYVSTPGNFRTVVWQQHVDDIPVFEAIFKAHLAKNGELINVDSQFVPDLQGALGKIANRPSLQTNPPISAHRAIVLAAGNIGDVLTTNQITEQDTPQGSEKFQHFRGFPILNNTSARLTWLPVDAGNLRLCWDVSLESRSRHELYRVLVDAVTGEIWLRQCLTEYLSNISLNVWTGESPSPLSPALSSVSSFQPALVSRTLVTLPALDTTASPLGWINDGDNTTMGNNVDAHLDWDNDNIADPGSRPVGSPFRVFNFPMDLTTQQPRQYSNAVVVSLFYWNNWAHDKYYEMGFTEAAGNFQNERFGRGGYPGTAVQADGQDSYSSTNFNNANFNTPADGSPPRMQMYIFTGPNPNRDGDLDAGVMLHEYTHGVSSRLVGGGTGITALQTRGMGEGWSDFCALSLLSDPANDPNANYNVGAYVGYGEGASTNSAGLTNNYYFGLRRYPYSVNTNINPLTFKDIDTNQISAHAGVPFNPTASSNPTNADEVHYQGEVWCNTLWEARARLCQKYGNSIGNQTMLQLVLDGMKLVNVNPNFIDARNAILQADLNLTGGANLTDLWAAFAKRGMGIGAGAPQSTTTTGVIEKFAVPSQSSQPVVTVNSPTEEGFYSTAPTVSGTSDIISGQIGVQLYRFSDGLFYNPTNGTWGTIQATMVVNGLANWNLPLPPLADGVYELLVNGEDGISLSSTIYRDFNIDTSTPVLSISNPSEGASFALPPTVIGGVKDNYFVQQIRVVLERGADGAWYNFASNTWGTSVFDFNRNVELATVTGTNWTASLPTLADGTYDVQVQAVDHATNTTSWSVRHFVMDSIPPTVAFSPLTNAATVFDFSQLGGQVSETGTVTFRINEFDVEGNTNRYWNSAAWITNGNDPSVWLTANLSGLNWTPAQGTLPGRAYTRYGPYFVRAIASDAAGNKGTNEILLTRSTADTTPPVLSFNVPFEGQIFTNNYLPTFGGNSSDPESGLAAVDLYLYRQVAPSTYLYWNGTAWVSYSTNLATAYNNSIWSAPSGYSFPSGANLPNGAYSVQVSARNNEAPTATTSLSVNFTVDYHPVYVWTAGSFTDQYPDNNDNLWDNPANWDVLSVPPTNALVIINGGTPDATHIVDTNLYGLNLSGGNLSISNLNVKRFNFSGGQISSSGALTIPVDGTMTNSGSGDKTLGYGVIINNFGAATWTGSGNIDFQAGSVINNVGTFNAQNDALFYFSTGGSPTPVFNNLGTFRKTIATNATVIRVDNGGVVFNNFGLVDIQTGVLSSQAQFNFNTGGSFSGAGVTSIDGNIGTMYATNTILNGGTVALAAGQLNGTGAFTGPGNFNWTGGTINGTVGTVAAGNMLISGNGDKFLGGTLNNAGHAVWTGSGNVNIHASAICNNSGTFIAQNDAWFYFDTGGSPAPAFNNSGTFIKNTGTNTTAFRVDNGGVNFNNSGTVNIQSGTLALAGGGTHTNASFNPSAGALITLPGGAHNFNGGLTFTGLGVTRLNGALVVLGGGTNTVQTNATFEIAGGTMAGTGTYNGAGLFSWTGGYISANLTMLSGSTLSLNGSGDKVLGSGGTINNLGTAIWTGSGNFFGQAGTTFNNTNLFLIQNDSSFYNDTGGGPAPVFNNFGIVRKTVATNITTVLNNNSPWLFNNSGVFDIQTGVLSFNTGANFNPGGLFSGAGKTQLANATSSLSGTNTIAVGGTFEIAGSGTLFGNGAFHGPGTLSWTGGNISGTLSLLLDAVLNVNGAGDKTLLGSSAINNFGAATWTGVGNLLMQAGSAFSNGGAFNLQNDALFYNSTGGSPTPIFNNTGTFRKTIATNATVIRADNGGVTFNNSGLVDIQTGVLSSQAQFNFNAGGIFSGAGLTSIDANTGTMSGTNTILSGGNVFLANGQLNGTGAFTGPGNFNWTGGTINGTIGTAAAGNMLISGNGDKFLGGTLNNAGHAVWTGLGNVDIHASAICNNSGTFTAQNDGYFYFDTGGSPFPAFNNSGTFVKNIGTNTTSFRGDNGGVTFNNSGNVNIQSGTLALAGGGTHANASFNPSAGALITLPGGAHNFNGGLTFTGLGVTRLNGALVVLGGGTNTVQTNAIFEIAGGTMAGTGAYNGTGLFSWTGGFISANLTMLSGSTLSLNGSNDKYVGNGGTINNLGTAVWTGTGNFTGQAGGVFNNTNLFLIQNDSVFYNDTGGSPAPVFNNFGTVRKTVATNVTTVLANNSPWLFNNSGVFDIQTGVLSFNAGANFNPGGTFSGAGKTQLANAASSLNGTNTIASGGTFEIARSGTLFGNGAFHGPGALSWAGGNIYGTLNLLVDAVLAVNGSADKTLLGNSTINNFGTAIWTGIGNINLQAGTAFNNGGTYNAQNDQYFYFSTGGAPAPIFNNLGTLRKTIATGTTTFRPDNGGINLYNSGTVDLQTGTLAINAGYSPLNSEILKVSLSGTNASTQFGRETFPGNAPLTGTLQVALANGYIPTNGSSFDIVGYGSHTGQFTATQLPLLPFGSAWKVEYNANAVTLRVVPPFINGMPKRLANGHIQFNFTGPTASAAILEMSTNLVQWFPIVTNSPFTGSILFDDHPAANITNRFYQVLVLP